MDYLRDLSSQEDFSISQLSNALQSLQDDIVLDTTGTFERKKQIISELFFIAGKPKVSMKKDLWERVRFNIYCFIASMLPDHNMIPPISLKTSSGPLFYIISLLLKYRQSNAEQIDELINIFNIFKNDIYSTKTTVHQFYTRSMLAYSHFIPILILRDKPEKIEELFKPIFDIIKDRNKVMLKNEKNDNTTMTYQAYQFINELVNFLNLKKVDRLFNEAGKIMMVSIRFNIPISSVLIHQYFPFIKSCFSKECQYADKVNGLIKMAEIFFQNSQTRINDVFKGVIDIHHSFDFFESVSEKKQIIQVMHFICQIFHPKMQNFHGLDDKKILNFLQVLSKRLFPTFKWPLIFFIEKLVNSLNFVTSKLNLIKGIKIGKNASPIITFYEQSFEFNDHNQLDQILFSSFDCRKYDTREEAIKTYEKSLKLYEVTKKLVFQLHFLYYLLLLSKTLENSELDETQANSYLQFYIERLLITFFNLYIHSSYRYMLLNAFIKAESLPNLKWPSEYFRSIFKMFVHPKKEVPVSMQFFASTFANCLLNAVKKRIISYQCIFWYMQEAQKTTFNDYLVQNMMNIAYGLAEKLNDADNYQVVTFQQWVLLMLKIGTKLPNGPQNTNFASLLRNYQRSLIAIICSQLGYYRKAFIYNKSELITTMVNYMKIMKDNSPEPLLAQFRDPQCKMLNKTPRTPYLQDFRPENRKEIVQLLLDNCVFEIPSNYNISNLLNLVYGFLSDDIELVNVSVEIALNNVYDNDKMIEYFLDNDIETNQLFFKNLFNSIRKSSKDKAIQTIDSIVKMAPNFLSYKSNRLIKEKGFVFEPFNIEISRIYNEILMNSSKTESEARHTFMLISYLVESKIILEFQMNDLIITFDILLTLSRFNRIKQKITSLFNTLNKMFTSIIETGNYDYIYSLLFSCQIVISESTDYFISILKSLINNLQITILIAHDIIEKMFNKLNPPYQSFNILIFLLLMTKKFPGCVSINNIASFFVILRDHTNLNSNVLPHFILTQLCQTLDTFLQLFIGTLNEEQRRVFINIAFNMTKQKNLVSGIRCIIINIITTMNIPLSTSSFDFIRNPSNDSFYCQLSSIIGCGANTHSIPKEVVDRSLKSLRKGENNMPISTNDVVTRLTFIKMITKAKIDISPYLEKTTVYHFLTFLKGVHSMSQYEADINYCIAWFSMKCPDIAEQCMREVNLNEKMHLIEENQQKIRQFIATISVFTNLVSQSHIQIVFCLLEEYIILPEKQKIIAFHNFSKLIKFLSSIDYSINNLRSFMATNFKERVTYLTEYIHIIASVLMIANLPFDSLLMESVIKFLLIFKKEAFDFILVHPYRTEIKYVYDLLYNLIISDQSNECFLYFSHLIAPDSKQQLFKKLHPYIFEIESRLSENFRFASNYQFVKVVKFQFHALFERNHSDYFSDNDTYALNSVIKTFINITKINVEYDHLCQLSVFFASGSNAYTSLYTKFKNDIFYGKKFEFYAELVNNVIKDIDMPPNSSNIGILLSNLIRGIGTFPESGKHIYIKIISTLKILLYNPSQWVSALKCYYTLLKYCNNVTFPDIAPVIHIFPLSLSQPDPFPILLTLKFILRLFTHDMLPEIILSQTLQHILQFKLFDPPYTFVSNLLFKKANEFYKDKEIPYEICEAFNVFIIGKVVTCKELEKVIIVLQHFPLIAKNIPFSVFYSILHGTLTRCDQNSIDSQIGVINYMLRLFQSTPISEEIEKLFGETSFKILNNYINMIDKIIIKSAIMDQVLLLWMKYASYMPESLLRLCNKNMNALNNVNPNLINPVNQTLNTRINPKYANPKNNPMINNMNIINNPMLNNMNNPGMNSNVMNAHNINNLINPNNPANLAMKIYIDIAVLATEKVDENILLKYQKFIEDSVENLIFSKMFTKISLEYLKVYIQSIFSRPKLTPVFGKHFFKCIEQSKENADKTLTVIKIYIRNTNHSEKAPFLLHLWKFVENSQANIVSLWLQSMFSFITSINPEQQSYFFNVVFTKMLERNIPLTFSSINDFLSSKNVLNNIKIEFLQKLPDLLPTFSIDIIEKMSVLIKELPFDTEQYQNLIMFYNIVKCQTNARLLLFESFSNKLGINEEERFISIVRQLPFTIWINKNLPFIIFLIIYNISSIKYTNSNYDNTLNQNETSEQIESSENNNSNGCSIRISAMEPLAMLCECFTSIISQIAEPVFSKIINQKTTPLMHSLLVSVLKMKKSAKYSEIISLITSTFMKHQNLHFSANLLYKSIKTTNETYLFDSFNFNSDSTIPDKLLLPHKLNDKIFSILPEDSSIDLLAASAQFFLSNYEESVKVFSCSPNIPDDLSNFGQSNIFDRISKISNDFVQKEDSFHILERLEHDDALLVPTLQKAFESSMRSATDQANNSLLNSSMYNILYLKHHEHPSFYEKQRIITTELIISLIRSKIDDSKRLAIPQSYINAVAFPALSRFILLIEKRINSTKNDNAIPIPTGLKQANEPFVIFPPEYRNLFHNILETNSHGFFSVPVSMINDVSNVISPKHLTITNPVTQTPNATAINPTIGSLTISNSGSSHIVNNVSNSSDQWSSCEQKWPGFCFNLLTSSSNISPELHFSALQGYLHLIKHSTNSFFMLQSYAARALTLFNIAANDIGQLTNSLNLAQTLDKELGSYLRFWTALFVDLHLNNSRFQQATIELTKFMSIQNTIFAHEATKQTIPILDVFKYLGNIFKQIMKIDISEFEGKSTFRDIAYSLDPIYEVDTIKKNLNDLNNLRIPIEFDMRLPYNYSESKLKILRINDDFKKIDDNIIVFTAITSTNPSQMFIVEHVGQAEPKSDSTNNLNTNNFGSTNNFSSMNNSSHNSMNHKNSHNMSGGFKKSTDEIVTFSNTLFLIKQMMKFGYSSRMRNITLCAPLAVEVGPGIVMYAIPPNSMTVSDVEKYNELSLEKLTCKYHPKEFLKLRKSLLSSFSVYSVVRNAFSLDQPTPLNMLISLSTGEVPLIYSQFQIPEKPSQNATLIPKQFIEFFGKSFDREFLMNFAASSHTIAQYIDSFRAIIEIPIQESLLHGYKTFDNIFQKRDIIDETLLDLSPPTSEGATAEDSVEWFKRLQDFINRSKQPFDKVFRQIEKIEDHVEFQQNSFLPQHTLSIGFGSEYPTQGDDDFSWINA
ncbi:hypothetical protein TRFO_31648 [Tritrichomonas foetus]|uniref:Uncharacterized protein n=1 Tax=Tritrichomonas foetus TaxID=1144522 RepID=A0A1J4JW35_9EUKA|nr:hypothetical protein [Tritrichomonas foetus]OHT01501.1 hypothetical protein TRFO_31648 [Tritrichomonas foetus]|eukprot:OHT01501.1 hypothetical protein TRFO_31648 [Tritrichomonas foetus]